MGILHHLVDFLFPSHCVACGKKDTVFCATCISSIPSADPFPKEWVTPLFYYKDPKIRKALWALKYRNKRAVGTMLGRLLYEHFQEDAAEMLLFANTKKWLVVPIPTSHARMRKRGYNQAAVLVEGFCKADTENIFVSEIHTLLKMRDTKSQTETKNRTERLGNVKDSMTVKNKEIVRGQNIILIDDIATTGATLTDARRALKQAGAKNVIALTVAH